MSLFIFLPFTKIAAEDNTNVQAVITVNPNITYQTIEGWEATAQAGEKDFAASFSYYADSLFDQAVNDLGINRLRLETHRANGPAGRQTGTGFDLANLDITIEKVVIPIKQRLETRGEKLFLNICVVGNGYATDPPGYAQSALALMQHMQGKYGFLPDMWEIALEPDTFRWGSTDNIGHALLSTVNIFKANGLPTNKYFVLPSNTTMDSAVNWFDSLMQNYITPNGLTNVVREFSYHRYGGVSSQTLQSIGDRGSQYGIHTAMLEHIGSSYQDLYDDLTIGMNSSWSQYTLAYQYSDNGGQYYILNLSNPTVPVVTMADRTKFLRQYFKFIRTGAVRINASTSDNNFMPVAFKNADGRNQNTFTVVVNANSGGSFSIAGLSPGTYGIKYTTSSEYDRNLPNVAINSGQRLTTIVPAAGVLTVFALSSSTPTSSLFPGDINNDHRVDIFDYNLLVIDFGKTGSPGFRVADIDRNGRVDIFDYNMLVGNFGK